MHFHICLMHWNIPLTYHMQGLSPKEAGVPHHLQNPAVRLNQLPLHTFPAEKELI